MGPYARLVNFTPDKNWLEDVGEEGAVNRELELALGCRDDNNTFPIQERGHSIEALANILEKYLAIYPSSILLMSWFDGLQWLDDNLPLELKNIEHCNFLIADTFDITSAFLLDILGDENVEANTSQAKTVQTDSGKGKAKAVSYQPQDDEWSTF